MTDAPELPAQRRATTVTQADVAAAAGVSTASVSRVLNNSPLVRPKVRARVEAAVEQLGYVPHSAARALALNRTYTIGAVIPTLNNAIFARGINAFEAGLKARGYTLLLSVSNYDLGVEREQVRRLIERGVDGLMLIGTDHEAETFALLERTGTAFVCTWSLSPRKKLPTVGFDNRAAMALIVDHLVAEGHSQIAMIAGITAGNDRARERVAGFKAALARDGLKLPAKWLAEIPYSVPRARAALADLVDRPQRPSAVVCGNDVIAYGAMFEAAALGLAVPGDLSVVGFDNLALSEHIHPGLTTVDVPADAMGQGAADRLADIIEGKVDSAAVNVPLETRLIVRGSSGPAIGGRS